MPVVETMTSAGGSSSDRRLVTTLRPFVSFAETTSLGSVSLADPNAVRLIITVTLAVSSPRAMPQRYASASRLTGTLPR